MKAKLFWCVIIAISVVTASQAQESRHIDYAKAVINAGGNGNRIYATQHDSEIVFITNGLNHDSLITTWNGFKVTYLAKDSLYNYVLKCGTPRYVIEIVETSIMSSGCHFKFICYTAAKNGRKHNLLMGIVSSDQVSISFK